MFILNLTVAADPLSGKNESYCVQRVCAKNFTEEFTLKSNSSYELEMLTISVFKKEKMCLRSSWLFKRKSLTRFVSQHTWELFQFWLGLFSRQECARSTFNHRCWAADMTSVICLGALQCLCQGQRKSLIMFSCVITLLTLDCYVRPCCVLPTCFGDKWNYIFY